ncbi:hypothetical protein HU200_021573 [Digitaria exilis]|uniref:Uncharacterized protein n=1 Tax=Digitaria exilis TaxID=1010633 RepID=A0A835EZ99_9POAL|nr:hypothetical protein HU200_021573 [Digitaria exilis]
MPGKWQVKIVVDHTCELEQLASRHHNLTAAFIANYMYPQIWKCSRRIGGTDDDDDVDENMGQFDNQEWVQQYYGSGQHDVVGPSQLSGAPIPTQGATQEDLTALPEAGRRPGRDIVPPDPLTGTGCGETCQERGAKALAVGTVRRPHYPKCSACCRTPSSSAPHDPASSIQTDPLHTAASERCKGVNDGLADHQ